MAFCSGMVASVTITKHAGWAAQATEVSCLTVVEAGVQGHGAGSLLSPEASPPCACTSLLSLWVSKFQFLQ